MSGIMKLPKKIDRTPDCRCPWFSGVNCKYQCAPRVESCGRCCVEAVIFESGQFQPPRQGTLPAEAGERSREAARRVLEGENPVGDSLYFYHPGISRCEWIRGRETVAVVGVHVFAR